MRVTTVAAAAAAAGLITLAVGCGPGGSTLTAGAVAGSTTRVSFGAQAVGADPYRTAAQQLIKPCFTATHLVAARSCIAGKVAPTERKALTDCLTTKVAGSVGKRGASAAFKTGAETCTATALRS